MTRLSWNEIEGAAQKIEAWALDLLERWNDLQALWAPYATKLNQSPGRPGRD